MHLDIYLYKEPNPEWPGQRRVNFALWEKFSEKTSAYFEDFIHSKIWATPSDLSQAVYVAGSDYCTLCSQGRPVPVGKELVHWGDCKDCSVVDQSPNYLGEGYFHNHYLIASKNRRTVVFVWNKVSDPTPVTAAKSWGIAQGILDKIPDTCFDDEDSEDYLAMGVSPPTPHEIDIHDFSMRVKSIFKR